MLGRYAKLNRSALQELAELRAGDALALLKSGRFHASYYLMGYSIECALKACIAKEAREHDFPDRELARKVRTHDLELLLRVAGLDVDSEKEAERSPEFEMNWTVVRDWNPESRYDLVVTAEKAEALCSACTQGPDGVFNWIQRQW